MCVVCVRPHISADVPTIVVRRGSAVRLATRRTAARALLAGSLAARAPRARDLRAVPLRAALHLRDSRLRLASPPPAPPCAGGEADAGGEAEAGAGAEAGARLACGAPDVEALVAELARAGAGGARVERGADGCIVHLPRHDTLVHVDRHATHVFCEGGPEVRRALRRALAACVPHV